MFTDKQNLVVPKGRIFIDLLDANGNKQGERYLGKSSAFDLTVDSETLEYIDGESGLNEKFEEVVTQVTRTFSVTVNNINPDNDALYYIADVNKKTMAAGSVTAEPITVKKGHYYQLGQDATDPTGARGVENPVVNDPGEASPPTYVENTDYTFDGETGLIYIMPGGSIADDTALEIDYDTTAVEWDHVVASDAGQKNASLRFLADNPVGPNQDVYAPKAAVRPTGTRTLKSNEGNWAQLQLEIEVLKPASGASLYSDSRPVSTV